MKYIHLNCIREWLENKKKVHEADPVTVYYWQGVKCEICKTTYSTHAKIEGTDREECIFKFDLPKKMKYMIL